MGMASTVLVAGLLGTACLGTEDGLKNWGFLWNLWESGIQLRVCRIGILFTLPWLDEVAVPSEALSSCWDLNHVGVGFSAVITYHSFFIFPRIRILEPYILSYLEWQCPIIKETGELAISKKKSEVDVGPWPTSQDKVSQDKVSQDKVSQDKVSQDKVSQDKVSQDKVSQDKVS